MYTTQSGHHICECRNMRRFIVAGLVIGGALGCHGANPVSLGPTASIIVAFGDSLTSGPGLRPDQTYPALLQQRISSEGGDYRVINAGVSGDTSTDALLRFDDALVADTRIVIIAIGANDGLRGVPVATVEGNIAAMIERAQARGINVLLCQMEAPPIGGLSYTIEFHRVYTRLADRYKVPLVPFVLLGVIGNDDLDLDDTLHPNAAGHKVIADTIWPYLRRML
jgi:acyl-CoA thioesterase-1